MYDLARAVDSPDFIARLRAALADPAALPPLRDAKLKVTSRCNLACQMCDYWKTTREETLSTPRWRGVLDELVELGARKVHVSGGEPFLRRDLLDILDHACVRGLKTNLTTNGTLVTREAARRLVGLGVNSVSVSLDGPTARVHDAIRGRPGAFKRSVKTIRWLVRDAERSGARLKVRINFVLQRDNYRRFPDMVRLAAELGAVDLDPMPVDGDDPALRLGRRALEELEREIAPQVRALRAELGFRLDEGRTLPCGAGSRAARYAKLGLYARGYYETHPCYAPWVHTFVAWNGDLFLCCMTTGVIEPLGNVRATPLRAALRGERYQAVRRAFLAGQRLSHCHRCDLFLAGNARLEDALGRTPRRLAVVERGPA